MRGTAAARCMSAWCELGAMSSLCEIIPQARQWNIIHRRSTNKLHSAFPASQGSLFYFTTVCSNGYLHPSSCIFSTSYPAAQSADEHPSPSTWVSYDQPPCWRHCRSLSLRTAPTQALPTLSTTLALFLARHLHRNTLLHGVRVSATGRVPTPKPGSSFPSSLCSRRST
jgi:hypothetical protein